MLYTYFGRIYYPSNSKLKYIELSKQHSKICVLEEQAIQVFLSIIKHISIFYTFFDRRSKSTVVLFWLKLRDILYYEALAFC